MITEIQFNCTAKIKERMKTMNLKITMAAARENAGLSQKQFAEQCGVSESTVINWEKGRTSPDLKKIPLLEKAYGIPLDYVKMPY